MPRDVFVRRAGLSQRGLGLETWVEVFVFYISCDIYIFLLCLPVSSLIFWNTRFWSYPRLGMVLSWSCCGFYLAIVFALVVFCTVFFFLLMSWSWYGIVLIFYLGVHLGLLPI